MVIRYLIQDHWQIFADRLVESGAAADLIEEIMITAWDDDDGEPPVNANELYLRRKSSIGYLEAFDQFLAEAREVEAAELRFPEALDADIFRFEENFP